MIYIKITLRNYIVSIGAENVIILCTDWSVVHEIIFHAH